MEAQKVVENRTQESPEQKTKRIKVETLEDEIDSAIAKGEDISSLMALWERESSDWLMALRT